MSDLKLFDIFDPRGRADRKGLILTAAVLLGAQAGVAATLYATSFTLQVPAAMAVESAFLWLGVVAVSKRLHDLGRSFKSVGWALLAMMIAAIAVAFAVMFTLGEDALLPNAPGYWAVAAAIFLPTIAATFWLHCAPGDKGPNRFGPVPDATGFSRPHGNRRTTSSIASAQPAMS